MQGNDRSGSDNISASASPLRRRSRRSGPLRMLTLTHFHKISRAEGLLDNIKGHYLSQLMLRKLNQQRSTPSTRHFNFVELCMCRCTH